MTGRVAVALLLAIAGCEASLGGSPEAAQDAPVGDAPIVVDAGGDAPVDARPCMGGNAAAVAPDGSCLVHFTTPATYVNAKAGCATINAHLAYIKTAELDTFAENFVGTRDTWIGGSDRVTEGQFLWEDGTAFMFTAWAAGEPNNANNNFQEDCVIIAGARTSKLWDDRPCDASEVSTSGNFAYLCQY